MWNVVRLITTTPTWCLYCWLWAYFTPISSVSFVDFEHVFCLLGSEMLTVSKLHFFCFKIIIWIISPEEIYLQKSFPFSQSWGVKKWGIIVLFILHLYNIKSTFYIYIYPRGYSQWKFQTVGFWIILTGKNHAQWKGNSTYQTENFQR